VSVSEENHSLCPSTLKGLRSKTQFLSTIVRLAILGHNVNRKFTSNNNLNQFYKIHFIKFYKSADQANNGSPFKTAAVAKESDRTLYTIAIIDFTMPQRRSVLVVAATAGTYVPDAACSTCSFT
jgi:hypothetical protein